MDKKFWPSGAGIQTPDFLKFAPKIWIIKSDETKSRQGTYNFSTLGLTKNYWDHPAPQYIPLALQCLRGNWRMYVEWKLQGSDQPIFIYF